MKIAGLFSSYWKTMLIVFILGVFRGYAPAQCASVQALYKIAPGIAIKCGVGELCSDISTPPKLYLQQQDIYTGSGSLDSSLVIYGGGLSFSSASYNYTITDKYNSQDCSDQTSYSGNAKYNSESSNPDGNDSSESLSATMDPTTSAWSDGSSSTNAYNSAKTITTYDPEGSPTLSGQCTSEMQTTNTSSSGAGDDDDGGTTSWSQTETITTALSDEFTDEMLRSKLIAAIEASGYPSDWTINPPNVGFGSASYSLDSNHYNASGSKMEYKFHITDCQPNTSYWVTWDEVTTYPNSSASSVQHMQEDIEGSGDPVNGVDGSVHTVNVPGTPSTISVDNINVTYAPWNGSF
jgi:hypothetical protein